MSGANVWVLLPFTGRGRRVPRSFPRKRESSPSTANFRKFSKWIPAFAGMTGAFAGMTNGSRGPHSDDIITRLPQELDFRLFEGYIVKELMSSKLSLPNAGFRRVSRPPHDGYSHI
jgi:hypothetical protein